MKTSFFTQSKTLAISLLVASVAMLVAEPALAAGGLQKVDGLIESILSEMHVISIGIVTIAIMWAGYRFTFKSAGMNEIIMIVGGAILIGGAGEFANWMLG